MPAQKKQAFFILYSLSIALNDSNIKQNNLIKNINMEKIWSPWRSQYIDTLKDSNKNKSACFICDAVNASKDISDKETFEQINKKLLIVARRKHCIVIMNKYPYNSGHTLVAPLKHISEIEELSIEEMTSIMITIQEVIAAMKKTFVPHGFNVGVNIGQSAGAGLPDHIHFHIVPRWNGDSNFISTVADIRVISHEIENTRLQLAELLNSNI